MKYLKKGFTIFELLIVIAISSVFVYISISVFSKLSNAESLDKEASNVISYIDKAKNDSVNSLNFEEHGVKFASSTVTIFYGKNYSGSATSSVYTLAGQDTISNVSFLNASTTIYFNKLTGEPSSTGTITISRTDGTQKVIAIYATGYIEIQ